MKKNYLLLFCLNCFLGQFLFAGAPPLDDYNCNQTAQYLYWTGEENQDFFNENNWRLAKQKPINPSDPIENHRCLPGANKEDYQICLGDHDLGSDKHPAAGTLEPGLPIAYNLYASGAQIQVSGAIHFSCDTKGLTVSQSDLRVDGQWSNGVLSLDNRSTAKFSVKQESLPQSRFNLLDSESWVYFIKNDPVMLEAEALNQIYVADLPGVYKANFRLDQYYQQGTLLLQQDDAYEPLEIFEGSGLSGNSATVKPFQIHSGAAIPGGLDNSISSFVLKRGYQVTLAVQENGTSMSKVYIASEEDLVVEELPAALNNTVSFIRVLPWEWIVKKGTGGNIAVVNAGWFYNWNNNQETQTNYKYVPMAWGASGATADAVKRMTAKAEVNHILGFNESDNCEDQSGQFNNLCEPEVAVAYFENLMKTGLRIGTPAPRENGPFGWLAEFSELATARNIRFDYVAVHWYDWASNPQNTPNASAQDIFNRFKAYLKRVHDAYQLPIWITEFNANPNRTNAIQDEFLRLALPYLESLDYVERYAYFQPNSNLSSNPVESANYQDEAGNLTNIGLLYRDHISSPSIANSTYAAPNNLEGLDLNFEEQEPVVLVYEAECTSYLGNQLVAVEDTNASNGYYLKLDSGREGASVLAKQLHFDISIPKAQNYRIWLRYKSSNAANTGVRMYIDETEVAENISGLRNAQFDWEQLPRFVDLTAGTHRITLEPANERMLIDGIALTTGSETIDFAGAAADTCVTAEERWGATETTALYFAEAEQAGLGSDWTVKTSPTAINQAYIESNLNAASTPPAGTGLAVFEIDVTEAGRYNLWGKVQALTEASDAFWVSVDNGPFLKWDGLKASAFMWKWSKVYNAIADEEQALSYFLTAGNHQVSVAYAEAGTKLDRIALAGFNQNPATVDPDVLFPNTALEFEAEDAIIIGNAAFQNCESSSNGQQVRPAAFNSNRIRFEGIAVAQGGTYTLKVHYMSKNIRNFGLRVNEENLGNRPIASSGLWCFESGVPAVYEVEINLVAGENSIELTGASGDAPFFDKIVVVKELIYELEAENATLTGGSFVQYCDAASQGAYVNTREFNGNAIVFENITTTQAGEYDLKIDYVSAVPRSMGLKLNDAQVESLDFADSGEWCFNGGQPGQLVQRVSLNAGVNRISLVNAGVVAPLIDKISIRLVEASASAVSKSKAGKTTAPAVASISETPESAILDSEFRIYPNPLRSGALLRVQLPVTWDSAVKLEVLDVSGRVLYKEENKSANNLDLQASQFASGMYLLRVSNEKDQLVKRFVIQ
ncbi:glycosyl hydrolase [Leeuwenhoekiella parthenopeia]|uniref:T9SS type A sorting domain-containing protein n=1 Tax=Leeuwenhoekiella parthenopeia TaxID=2890320 RepID=A0ABS8GMM0_9FLAO|nr:glycosyl hydrolase [Leeuwenhoekiella parthenopeia]MCC4211221.1 T9SS type A sorting domain-containing protein [Leeuwenhoekiella parthenopeia]